MDQLKPKVCQIVRPAPYFCIEFGCSNRAFYSVRADLYVIAEEAGIELGDGYMSEECDYEGDLERIIIYNGDREKVLIDAVLKHYGIHDCDVPKGHSVILSI